MQLLAEQHRPTLDSHTFFDARFLCHQLRRLIGIRAELACHTESGLDAPVQINDF